jgi:predicted phage terminase large subunit-like protein
VNDVQAELLAAEAALALRSPLDMGRYVNRRDRWDPKSTAFEAYRYTKLLSDTIVDFVEHPTAKYLLLSGPVRSGKSHVVSRTAPTWFLARYPDRHLIMSGYGSAFASTWGRFTRDQIAAHPELGISIDPSARSVEHFALARPHVGSATFTGVGGSITGRGAHLFIIDDPTKTAEEAMSETYQQKLEDWFWSVADTRLEPGGKLILMQARWAFADTYGRLADRLPADVTWRIETPAIADGNPYDPTGRELGEPLVPERYDLAALEAIKAKTDPWVFHALYQCSPQAEEGGLFAKSGRRSYSTTPTHFILSQPDAPPVFLDRNKTRRFVTADLAATTKTANDWTVFSVWEAARLPQSEVSVILLTGVIRKRIDSADHLETALDVWRRFKLLFVGVEKATYGLTLLTQLRRKGVPVMELTPDKDKVARAIPASSAWNGGRVYLPTKEELEIVDELVEEATQFPNGKHDDWVDTLAYAVELLDVGAIGGSLGGLRDKPKGPEPGTVAWLRKRSSKKGRHRPVGV